MTAHPDRGRPVPEPSRGSASWSIGRRLIVVAIVVTLLWGVVVAVTALGTRTALRDAEALLLDARSAVQDGDLSTARTQLEDAGSILSSSRSSLERADMRVASLVPLIGRDLVIARGIVQAADDVVSRSLPLLDRVNLIADGDLNAKGLPVDAIAEIAPDLREAADAALSAVIRIRNTPRRGFTTEVVEGRTRVLDILEPAADQLDRAAGVMAVLPDFLGADGPRRYLVAAANPAELRGVGGYLGSYTTLQIRDGDLAFGTFEALNERTDLTAGDIPLEVLDDRYRAFGGTWRWKNANMTPDMPSAARALSLMWTRQTGQSLDGVLVVDPFALETMLAVTGPVTAADGTVLDAGNVVAHLTNEAYANYDDTLVRKEELGDAAKVVLETFLGQGSDLLDQIGDLAQLVSERQLLLFSTDADTQLAFEMAGMAGALEDPDGDMVAVVANSATNAKVDFYLDRELHYDVRLHADGSADADLEIVFRNSAPRTGQSKYVIGPNVDGLEAGDNRFHLSTFCSTRCEIVGAMGGLSGRSLIDRELDHPVAGTWVEVPSGGEATLRYQWTTDRAWRWEGRELVYRLFVRTQTAIRAPVLDLRLAIPKGFAFAGGSEGLVVDGDVVRLQSNERGNISVEVRLRPA